MVAKRDEIAGMASRREKNFPSPGRCAVVGAARPTSLDNFVSRADPCGAGRGAFVRQILVVAAGTLLLSASAPPPTAGGNGPAVATPALAPGTPQGYLAPAALPDSLALLPPPPAPGSPGFARDEEGHTASIALAGSPRWAQATSDADLHFPHAAGTFSCAAGLPINPQQTPHLTALLARTMVDLGFSTYRAKKRYQRMRPFFVHNDASCTPDQQAFLSSDGSYPSGHSTIGWGWALILAELAPDRTDAILARGRDFGQSRIVCNVHWQSDVDAGRVMAAATIARLHADPLFRVDLEHARKEVERQRQSGAVPDRSCAAEAAALAVEP